MRHVKKQLKVNRTAFVFVFQILQKHSHPHLPSSGDAQTNSCKYKNPSSLGNSESISSSHLSPSTVSSVNNIKDCLEYAPKVIVIHIKDEIYCSRGSDSSLHGVRSVPQASVYLKSVTCNSDT